MRILRRFSLGFLIVVGSLFCFGVLVKAQTPTPSTQLTLAADSYTRTSTSGWGYADIGGAYLGTGSTDFKVNGSQGTVNITGAGIQRQALLTNINSQEVDMRIKVKTDKPASGADHNIFLLSRYDATAGHYRSRLNMNIDGTVSIRAQKYLTSTNTTMDLGSAGVEVPNLTFTPNTFIWIRSQTTGINPTTINLKAWADGQTEPSAWQATFTDSESGLQTGGDIGILVRLNAASTAFPALFTFDDFRANSGMIGDTNGDEVINSADVGNALSQYLQTSCGLTGDVDRNCKVNMLDLAQILTRITTATTPTPTASVTADVNVTINKSQIAATSQFSPGFTHVDESLENISTNNSTAVTSARNLVKTSTTFENSHIMAWGVSDPWVDPNTSEPTYWADMDGRINLANSLGATSIITLCEAPWWMKGQLQSNGTTKLIPNSLGEWDNHTYSTSFTDFRGITYPAGYVSPGPYSSRILDNQMSKWLLLVQRVAERYMAPPYNVRYFQVWNELKGYYNPNTNLYDFSTSAGDPSGYNAKHGYTYMYNQTYAKVRQVATNMGIPLSSVFIGGPYPVIGTWSETGAGGHATTETLLQNKPYGTFDQRELDAMKYWFQNKSGAEFIDIDMKNRNKPLAGSEDPSVLADPYISNNTFPDVINWIRSLNNTTYPGAATLPIFFAEWYSNPYHSFDPAFNNSVKSDAIIKIIKAGGRSALLWGGIQTGNWYVNQSLFTNTNVSGGGQAYPWYYSLKAIKDYFGPGTQIFSTISSSNNIAVMSGPVKTMLVNKTSSALSVNLSGVLHNLAAYEVKVVNTP